MELVICDTAETVAAYEHPEWGRYAAVTEHASGSGHALYLGAFFDDKLLGGILRGYLQKHGMEGLSPDAPHFPVIVKRGINDFGRELYYYLNYSGEPQTVRHTGGDGTELTEGGDVRRDAELTLDAWGVRIVEV